MEKIKKRRGPEYRAACVTDSCKLSAPKNRKTKEPAARSQISPELQWTSRPSGALSSSVRLTRSSRSRIIRSACMTHQFPSIPKVGTISLRMCVPGGIFAARKSASARLKAVACLMTRIWASESQRQVASANPKMKYASTFSLFRARFLNFFGTKDCCTLTFIALYLNTNCCA